jgi:hypothetical protein
VAWVRADQAALADPGRRHSVAADQLADQVVRQVAAIFFRHAAFLRPVMLVSAATPRSGAAALTTAANSATLSPRR